VLAEVGVDLPDDTDIKVWDSSGTHRWFVIPERPSGTEDFTAEELMDLVTTRAGQTIRPRRLLNRLRSPCCPRAPVFSGAGGPTDC
jgi:hypothetical protein